MAGFFQSISDFFHNATTGELTDSQKTDIINQSVNTNLFCQENPSAPECGTLLSSITADVNAAAPSTGCVLNIPGFGCFKSWNTVAFSVIGIALLIFLLPSLITASAARARYR